MKKLFGLLMGLVASFVLMTPVASAQTWGWTQTYTGQPGYSTQYANYGYSNPYYVAPVNYYYKQVSQVTPVAKAFYYLSTLPTQSQYSNYYPYGSYYTYNYNKVVTYDYVPTTQQYYKYGYKIGAKYANANTYYNAYNGGYYTVNPSYTVPTPSYYYWY